MGGNVFKDGSTRRYSAQEYHDLTYRMSVNLWNISSKFDIIPAYLEKESFGDVDVLIIPFGQLSKERLSSVFNTTEDHVVHNGDVWSLVFEEIQVDLITSNEEEYAASLDYFAWNDYGNLRGKIIHKFGLKFGHKGLSFPIRDDHHQLGEIILSRDPYEINKIFDFEYGVEYNTLEEMFESVVWSKYFNPKVFAWEEMNSVARIRDKKRTTYHAFLKYIENMSGDYFQYSKDKTIYHEQIFEWFPHAKEEFDILWEKKRQREVIREKFNGNLVSEWTGVVGKELGMLMVLIKKNLSEEDLLCYNESEIKDFVLNLFNQYNGIES